jgi:ribosomal-protein-alanine N-acetyltransferase
MKAISFTPFPNLETKQLKLRQLTLDDDNEIYALHSNEKNNQYLTRALAKSIEGSRNFITKINKGISENNVVMWGITLRDEDKVIGTICFWDLQKEHFRSQIGYELHPDYHRRGIMQEAITVVLEYGFNSMQLHSVEAHVAPDNVPSIKLLEKNRFVREAHYRENYFYNGKFLDTVVYSIVNDNDLQGI